MNKNCFSLAFKASIPVMIGYITIGIPYGFLLVKSGYPWWLAPLSGLTMYTGAGQYLAIGLFAAGTPVAAILITEFFITTRHIFYGLSLISKFKNCGWWRPYLIFSLTDETYSILTSMNVPEKYNAAAFYGTLSALNQFYWVLGGTVGALAGAAIPFQLNGIDFALTALFVVLAISQIENSKDFIPPFIGVLTALGTILLWRFGILKSSSNILLIAISAGVLAICAVRRGAFAALKDNSQKVDNLLKDKAAMASTDTAAISKSDGTIRTASEALENAGEER